MKDPQKAKSKPSKPTPRLCQWKIDGAKLTCTCKDSNRCIFKKYAKDIISDIEKSKPWRTLSKAQEKKGRENLMKGLLGL